MGFLSVFELFSARRPTANDLERLVSEQHDLSVTYADVGATLGAMPPGYNVMTGSRVAGSGTETFDRAKDAVRTWKAQEAMGMLLHPEPPPLVEGTTMAFALPVQQPLPLFATGCCRIVRVVDEPRSFGFVYGTLPHHPESGEEAFMVHHRSNDDVEFEITAFSKPAALAMKASGPVGRYMQRRALSTYLGGYVQATQLQQ